MTYMGEYKGRLRDGQGSYLFPPHGLFSYDGQWRKGEMHGQGLFSISNNTTDNNINNTNRDTVSYEGEFQDGEIEGIGLKCWSNGNSYSGQFHRGEMHGEGVFISTLGEKYDGQWHSNQRVGRGELVFINGDVYSGEFASHKPQGLGQIAFAKTGNVYEGEWKEGKIVGQGVLSDRDGNRLYEGAWLDGQRDRIGSGVVEEDDGLVSDIEDRQAVWYTGVWTQDRPAERPTRLVVKLMESTDASSRPPTAAAAALSVDEQGQREGGIKDEPLVLTDLPSTVSAGENKKLPQFAVLSVYDAQDEAAAGGNLTQPVTVNGESRRQIRLRVFEGEFVASPDIMTDLPAAADNSSIPPAEGDELAPDDVAPQPKSTQWYFVLERSLTNMQQQEPEAKAASQDQASDEDEASAGPENHIEKPEVRLDEVVVENSKGLALFQRLALPAATLPGSYHILCESVSSTDSLPPVVINVSIAG